MSPTLRITRRPGLSTPLIQAPMAVASTPALVAAGFNTGGLGSLAVGNVDATA
ncbi:hypothetical protein [Pandoraea pnomenusa]|uniref:hypothetical protein n=1 Tax=Pandoraea pnomenusa TaxID=93220 RepID=UPI000ADC0CEC